MKANRQLEGGYAAVRVAYYDKVVQPLYFLAKKINGNAGTSRQTKETSHRVFAV